MRAAHRQRLLTWPQDNRSRKIAKNISVLLTLPLKPVGAEIEL
jgi:hypothetical protein